MSSSVAIIKFEKYLGMYRVLTIYNFKRFDKSLLNLRVFNRISLRCLTLSSIIIGQILHAGD